MATKFPLAKIKAIKLIKIIKSKESGKKKSITTVKAIVAPSITSK